MAGEGATTVTTPFEPPDAAVRQQGLLNTDFMVDMDINMTSEKCLGEKSNGDRGKDDIGVDGQKETEGQSSKVSCAWLNFSPFFPSLLKFLGLGL